MSLTIISIISIVISIICLLIIAIDIIIHPQQMWIMNIVWPVTALYSGPVCLWVYFKIGRNNPGNKTMSDQHKEMMHDEKKKNENNKEVSWKSVIKGTLHCGSGCTLGDLVAESFLFFFSFALFGSTLYAGWLIDYFFAFAIGIIFQYYAIKPMKHLSSKQALAAALKADTLSLTAWQIGMYGWMAIAVFLIFHHLLKASSPVFWFMMQIGMLFGFFTAYPVNWWLIKKGIKEAM